MAESEKKLYDVDYIVMQTMVPVVLPGIMPTIVPVPLPVVLPIFMPPGTAKQKAAQAEATPAAAASEPTPTTETQTSPPSQATAGGAATKSAPAPSPKPEPIPIIPAEPAATETSAQQQPPPPPGSAAPAEPAPVQGEDVASATDETTAPNTPVKIRKIDKLSEIVQLENVTGEPVDLNGWRMVSVKGNQTHPGIGGTLAPGEKKFFANTGNKRIWHDTERDDGALYSSDGTLISYWKDA